MAVFSINLEHGDVYQWDLETRTCIKRWNDQAAINPSSIAISINNSFIATGSSSGVVNLYNAKSCLGTESSSNPDPLKSFMNLSTPINQVLFHPSNLVMAYSSSTKKDSLKLCHVDSQSVFSNWPTANTPLGYVQCMDFSPNGGYFGVGNDKGVALLFKLKQFSDY